MNRSKLPQEYLRKLEAHLMEAIERDSTDGNLNRTQAQNLIRHHEAFKTALDSKAIAVGSLHEPRMLSEFGTNSEQIFDSLMNFVQPVVWLAFVLAALFTRQWWLLLGIPATWFGIPLRILVIPKAATVIFPIACALFAVNLIEKQNVWGWPLLGLVAGYLAEDIARRHFRRVMENRAYESAVCFAYLQLEGPVSVRACLKTLES